MTTILITARLFIKTLLDHLQLSVSSIKFYEKVFTSYRGYGIKYIFILSTISSLICCVVFLNQTNKINNYLNYGQVSRDTQYIDQIITQLPIIEYDGRNISLQENTPLYINDLEDQKILAIDPKNQLSFTDKNKIPIIFAKDTLIVTVSGQREDLRKTIPIKYTQIFGPESQILNQEFIKSTLASLMKKVPTLFIYIIFPLLTGLILISTLLDKVFMIIMLLFITKISKINATMQSCIRTVLFASGLYSLLHLPLTLLTPLYIQSEQIADIVSLILPALQICANFLMILGVLKSTNKIKLFSFINNNRK